MISRWSVATVVLLAGGMLVAEQETVLINPTNRLCEDELVRLHVQAPGLPGDFVVMRNGREVPFQVENAGTSTQVWIRDTFEPEAVHRYRIVEGRPAKIEPAVTVRREGEEFLLENGVVAIRVPAEASGDKPLGPIAAVRTGPDKWVAESFWRTHLPLRSFSASVIGDGTVFGKVRLRYEFEGRAGIHGETPAFAELDVTLGPGWSHVQILERHEMHRGDYWELEASSGWSPTEGISKPFSHGAGSGLVGGKVEPRRRLEPGGLPYSREDLFINLFPRWNQHYKDGWCFAATDGNHHVGAVVVRASQWIWPHQNAIEAVVKPGGKYAGLRCPTWKGRRLWWLLAPTLEPADIAYVSRHAWEHLDKLNRDFILTWQGKEGRFPGMNFYNGGQVNPTGAIRGIGRRAIAQAGGNGDLSTLFRVQILMHPDAWGSYWDYWSPENPNFFTDFIKVPVALTTNLREHPQFEELRRRAELKVREDLYHSVTLPGGAGQECPGYVSYALGHWEGIAELCARYLDFDPTKWERFRAARYFKKRIAQPYRPGDRRALPMGDTHPAKDGSGPKPVEVSDAEVRRFVTEELPGFGVIFTSRPGTDEETYLAFKSGPNRGHYHGDQLAFHYCAHATALAVDHHCGYKPRAGQEHMHNRVAFHNDRFPWANMDGYERLIAFKASPEVDIAVGQVESERFRRVERLPPEIWHQEYPQYPFDEPLVYRRTIVFVKGGPEDYFVIRDQHRASESVAATFCLHVLSDRIRRKGPLVDFGNLSLYCAVPETFEFESFPWSHTNGGLESTQGARLTIHGREGEFITVLYPGPLPETTAVPGGVRVGTDVVTFAGGLSVTDGAAEQAAVARNGETLLELNGEDIDLDRSQGDIGLFVPDAGYPFGVIPDWLVRQRASRPTWAEAAIWYR